MDVVAVARCRKVGVEARIVQNEQAIAHLEIIFRLRDEIEGRPSRIGSTDIEDAHDIKLTAPGIVADAMVAYEL